MSVWNFLAKPVKTLMDRAGRREFLTRARARARILFWLFWAEVPLSQAWISTAEQSSAMLI